MQTEYSGFAQTGTNDDAATQEMINITSCDFKEFSAYMVKNYGDHAFNDGFKTIKTYQSMIYEENGEEKLIDMLKHLFSDVDSCKRFLNFCTTFLIVQNMV